MDKTAFTARVDADTLDYLRDCAKVDGVSIGKEIEMLLRLRRIINGNAVTGIKYDPAELYDTIGFKH